MKNWMAGVIGTIVLLSLVAAVSAKGRPAQTVCPVTGDRINKGIYSDYQGDRIYFCSKDCSARFQGNPEHYINRMAAQGALRHADNWDGRMCGSGSRGRGAGHAPSLWERIWGCWGANGTANRGCRW